MSNFSPAIFHTLLLAWFDQHGRRNLPWQINKTPYRIWISEIMLQQTQVKTVIPYFERFMQCFPDVLRLANASEDEVLHLWAGLGYYSRARNLHRAAQIIVKNYQGHFPNTVEKLKALPGIGQSTAGAIISIAFNQPAAILDGNVKRVFSRFHGIADPINQKSTENKLWRYANEYLPNKQFADYTQAIMDLGAMICTRTQPRCDLCPLTQHCAAHRSNIIHLIPMKKATAKLPIKQATFLVLRAQHQIFLEKRPINGIWGGLWSFPETEGKMEEKAIRAFCKTRMRASFKQLRHLTAFRHTFSHYHLDIHPVLVELLHIPLKIMEATSEIWYNPKIPQALGMPKPVQLILRELA